MDKLKPHPEDFCDKCKNKNIIWYVANDLWNEYSNNYEILCPICFVQKAEKAGFIPTAWELKANE